MRHCLLLVVLCIVFSINAFSQGYNHEMGEDSLSSYESLASRVLRLEKKHDAFNVWLNYAASFQTGDVADTWESRFANREIRLEVTGNITDRLSYRIRHRLNRNQDARGGDNFAKATDLAWIGYQIDDRWSVQGGKLCLAWGGFEYDENPMFIYRYSDFVDAMDIFMAGVGVSYKPNARHELALQATNTYNGSFAEEWGGQPVATDGALRHPEALERSRFPLTVIFNWNGQFAGGRVQTRYAYGMQTLAKDYYGWLLTLGHELRLPRLQWIVDYYGGWYDIDHLRYATTDMLQWRALYAPEAHAGGDNPAATSPAVNAVMSDVVYNSFVTKVNWQFAPRWNWMLKGTFETVSSPYDDVFDNYRKSFVYATSIEYYPVRRQNLRLFLAYLGHTVDYSRRSGLKDRHTNQVELGFMYRMKCF